MEPIFQGKVENGTLKIRNISDYYLHLRKLSGERVEIIVRKQRKTRTVQQNSYYWGVVVRLCSETTGYPPEDMHEILKGKFLGRSDGRFRWYRSTRSLTTAEMAEYIEDIKEWAALPSEQGGLETVIPDANSVYYE